MDVRVLAAGDSAWLIELPERIDPEVNSRAIRIASAVKKSVLPVSDVVVGYRSVMVYVDPLAEDGHLMEQRLRDLAVNTPDDESVAGELVDVPVCYDGPYGPDLPDVAAFGQCDVEEVIGRHLALEYRVFVVGFVPGFAYLAEVDPRIGAPRRPSPRTQVPAGSVAIAGGQTGIYPSATPGGWNIIGRTRVLPFDPARADPFMFKPGDSVRFTPV